MCQPPSEQSVRTVLSAVFPDVATEGIQAIPSPRLQRLYEVTIQDGKTMLLVLSPSPRLRLLRSEHFMVPSEARTVQWIRSWVESNPEAGQDVDEASNLQASFLPFIPTLIHFSPGANELGSPCSFFESTQGTPIALVPGLLSQQERRTVDQRLGRLFRHLAHLTCPSGRFGPAANCLSASSQSSPRRFIGGGIGGVGGSNSEAAMGGEGTETWSGAFHLMLEGILRDGEDMAVMVNYSAIRRNFKRFRHLLDLVTVPRLVVIDGGDESNVLVSSLPPPSPKDTAIADNDTGKNEETKGKEDGDGAMVFAGIRDWSACVFGDPLLATVFNDTTISPSFLEGFNHSTKVTTATEITTAEPSSSSPPSLSSQPSPLALDKAIIDDVETAPIRQLLYQVYHASVNVIKEFYRPRGGNESSRRELEARKKLTEALARLELVPEQDIQSLSKRSYRASRLSGEMSPAKRIKEEGGDA